MSVRFRKVRRMDVDEKPGDVEAKPVQQSASRPVSRPLKIRMDADVETEPVTKPAPIQQDYTNLVPVPREPVVQKNQGSHGQTRDTNETPVPVKVIEINVPDYENKTGKENPKTFTKFEENVQDAVSKMEQDKQKRELEEARKTALQREEKLFEETVNEPSTNAGNQPLSGNVLPHLYGVDPELVNIMRGAFTKYAQKKEAEFQEDLKKMENTLKRMGLDSETIQKSIEGFKQAVEKAVNAKVPSYVPSDFIVDPNLVFVYMPEPIRKIMDDLVSGKIRPTEKYPREE